MLVGNKLWKLSNQEGTMQYLRKYKKTIEEKPIHGSLFGYLHTCIWDV